MARTESNYGIGKSNQIPEIQNINDLVDLEDRLKAHTHINDLMKLSASVPSGFDMNCT